MKTVMIVEDERELVELYDIFLSRNGFSVVYKAYDGFDALEYYQQTEDYPDIIIMDYRMPMKDGKSTTKKILEINNKQKVVFLSADYTIRGTVEAMGSKFLGKPITLQLLLTTLEEV